MVCVYSNILIGERFWAAVVSSPRLWLFVRLVA
jgi:hypothetical protein